MEANVPGTYTEVEEDEKWSEKVAEKNRWTISFFISRLRAQFSLRMRSKSCWDVRTRTMPYVVLIESVFSVMIH